MARLLMRRAALQKVRLKPKKALRSPAGASARTVVKTWNAYGGLI